MATIKTEHRPSINIVRDSGVALDYLPTPNAKAVFHHLMSSVGSGRKSFNIIGAYGTGKSAFLWAFEKTVSEGEDRFETGFSGYGDADGFDIIRLVGEYHSITQVLALALGIEWDLYTRPAKVIEALEKKYQDGLDKGKGLLLMVDEFGKFLEYAAKNDPDGELYFLQMLAEFFNDPEKNALLLTTLHQDFSAYALGLDRRQRNEWDKVKGRYKELTFNEPVEQLLYLASERLKEPEAEPISPRGPKGKLFKAIEKANAFPLRDYFNKEVARNLEPLDILSAGILTLALQKFGQNQRSLFSFLESNDHLGLEEFRSAPSSPHYHLGHVFDYLQFNHQGILASKYNPEHAKWSGIRMAMEKADAEINKRNRDAMEILKVIGMLHLFASAGSQVDKAFLKDYAEKAMGISKADQVVEYLEKKKIIRYSNAHGKYLPVEGTDLDIELAIDEAGNLVERVAEVVPFINEEYSFPYLLAKEVFFQTGSPRIFGYTLSEVPEEDLQVTNYIDGHINLILSETYTLDLLQSVSAEDDSPVVYGLYQNSQDIGRVLLEIQKIRKVISDNPEDRIAQRELGNILTSQRRLLGHYVLGNHYGPNANIVWCYKGEVLKPRNAKEFNKLLSRVAREAYPSTPVFRNEMINRSKPSPVINTARNRLISRLIHHYQDADLGFEAHKFPAEKTIYLSLLKETGIHRKGDEGFGVDAPQVEGFQTLWESGKDFIQSSRDAKRNLGELVDIWKQRPFKLKQGLVDFWLPIFLFISRDEFALFSDGKYIPNLNDEIFQLIHKSPRNYEIKAFNTDGVHWKLFNQYRNFLQLPGEKKPGNESLIETIKPFLVFFQGLEDYAKLTKNNLSPRTLLLRDAISKARDPEVLFFESFPRVLDISLTDLKKDEEKLNQYIDNLKDCIRDLRTAYSRLLDRLESFLAENILGVDAEFPGYKDRLQKRLLGMRGQYVRQDLKVLLQRIDSPLDDRDSWLASLGQAITGKSMDKFNDQDEQKLFSDLGMKLDELFSLQELSVLAEDVEDQVYKLDILVPGEEKSSEVIRVSAREQKHISNLTKKVETALQGEDRKTILAILYQYLSKNEGDIGNE